MRSLQARYTPLLAPASRLAPLVSRPSPLASRASRRTRPASRGRGTARNGYRAMRFRLRARLETTWSDWMRTGIKAARRVCLDRRRRTRGAAMPAAAARAAGSSLRVRLALRRALREPCVKLAGDLRDRRVIPRDRRLDRQMQHLLDLAA
ncbi:hypothetical protein X880_3961 [Burkholderia pseudomallei MSHR4032]|nr:hypothetical protein X880_3961 [Burkholderia pseudomallei MSHR4032]KGV78185.1 hypothetical protein X890_5825 [Burkholderia pseudomallei MSHR4299]KGW00142.1 hypothetical protein X897_5772 [Burkholderia pseudomallei ABCPW 30]